MPRGRNIKLEEFGIPNGGEITCIHNSLVKATIIDGKLICLGKEVSLSKVVKYAYYFNKNNVEIDINSTEFKQLPWWGFGVHETLFYNGESLYKRRKRLEKEALIKEMQKYHEK